MELKSFKDKRYLIISVITFVAVIFGFFLFSSDNKTYYIKNNAPSLRVASIHQNLYQAEDRIGDLTNNIIPSIVVPENLTKNFAGLLAKEIIGNNNQPINSESPDEPGLNVPSPNKIAQDFIANGLKTANENILNIKPVQLTISQDNSKDAIKAYLSQANIIIKENLDTQKINLFDILNGLNENDGAGFVEKLTPVIIAHEQTANKLLEKPVPADLKELMTEEIRLLRITANIFKAIINVEEDPLGTITAIKQFDEIVKNWGELQQKFNQFTQKLNKT